MNTQLILYFVTSNEMPLFKDFEVFGQKKKIKFEIFETLKVPEDFFGEEYSKMICVKLVSESVESIIELKLNKNDDNYSYIFCNDVGKTYHLLFNQEKNPDEKIDIYIPSYNFNLDKYDTNKTKYRKRFILANAYFSYITINKIGIKLFELTKDLDQNASSYQLSIYDYKKAQIVTKSLEIPKQKKSFESIYNDNYHIFNKFIKDFNNSLEKEIDLKISSIN